MMPTPDCFTLGQAVCQALQGAWRASPPAVRISPEAFQAIAPGLSRSGSGALCWHALGNSPLAKTPEGRRLGKIYRNSLAAGAARERQIPQIADWLRSLQGEPLLVKGWSSARHYAHPWLRPYGDVDVCVPPQRLASLLPALEQNPDLAQHLDLHAGIPDLKGRTWDEAVARSQLVPLESTAIRILGAEDHLRLLCLHLVRHVLERPLWLCDIAAALENLPENFDWDYCLQGETWLAEWIECIVGLAQELLGAEVRDVPMRTKPGRFASWVAPYVHWKWGQQCLTALPGGADGRREAMRFLWYHKSNPLRWAWRLKLSPSHSMFRIQTQALLSRPWQLLVRIGRRWHEPTAVKSQAFEIHRERTF